MPRSQHKPIPIYFPAGISDRLRSIARQENLNPQYTALTLWQYQSRLTRKIIENEGRMRADDYLIPMNARVLQLTIGLGYVRHMQALVRHGVLELRLVHVKGVRSRHYSYTDEFNPLGKQDRFLLDQPTALNALARPRQKPDDPYFKARQDYLYQFDLDAQAALEWATVRAGTVKLKRKKPEVWLHEVQHQVELIVGGYRPLTKDEQGREHHPFLRLPRHIRKNYVTHGGQGLIQLDLPAAQPLLLWSEFNKRRADVQELERFRQALEQDFYKYMARQWKRRYSMPMSRKKMKKQMYRLFFGRVRHNLRISRLFRQCFPKMYQALASGKHRNKDHAVIATSLQHLESRVIFPVCEKLTELELHPFLTVHDCVATLPAHADRTEELMLEQLQLEGVNWCSSLRSS